MSTEEEFRAVYRQLTKAEALAALADLGLVPEEMRTRNTLFEAVVGLPAREECLFRCLERKRRRIDDESTQVIKRMRLVQGEEENLEEEFLADVGDDVRQRCVVDFIEATSNDVVSLCACLLCAGEFFARETKVYNVNDLPNKHLLRPARHHYRQTLVHGLSVYNAGLIDREGTLCGHVCRSCEGHLWAKSASPYFVINNLWIGEVPIELSILTLPERILVARYYPAAYIVKLYPRRKGAKHWDQETLNSGLRGNVSTYRLNTQDIVSMVEGRFLPPPPSLLAAIIGVTIVGPKNIPERSLPSVLSVSRNHVRNALQFLVCENPLYSDVVISEDNLSLLPEYGIPQELSAIVHVSEDVTALDEEHEGYVRDDSDITMHDSSSDAATTIPLQSYGVLDPAVSEIDERGVLARALANVSDEAYAVRRGSSFVSEYPRIDEEGHTSAGQPDNPNHLLGAFPWLFPYGTGGFEVERPVSLSYESQAKWALRYADKRFRLDHQFMFQVFGVLQKRQVCRSAVIQVKKTDYFNNFVAFQSLTPADLWLASKEEEKREAISNPTIRSLKRHVSAVRSHVMGTDESRTKIRSLVWGMVIKKNPPSLWITINPSDTHNPIAQVLSGAEIDLDRFERSSGPEPRERGVRIAKDPYAAAKFFHFIIETVLRTLFGIKCADGAIKRHEGIFGRVEGFIGTVEAQGRGTLHLHMLLWLQGAPSANRMKTLLEMNSFRERIAVFISKNIKACVSDEQMDIDHEAPVDSSISYSRPLDPRGVSYEREHEDIQRMMVNALQIHKCGPACTIVAKGRIVCKRHTPFPLASEAWIDEGGQWGPQRTNSMMNNWSPVILDTLSCNHDIKLITNGEETRDISFYFTNYATKQQHHTFNASALLARTLAYHQDQPTQFTNVQELNKRLIQRCANSLSRDQEFSAPEVVSYLMHWGDRYISHHFESIPISTVISLLKETYPVLCSRNISGNKAYCHGGSVIADEMFYQKDDPEYVVLENHEGKLRLRDRVKDYIERGSALEDFSLLDFFLNTYDVPKQSLVKQTELSRWKCNVRVPYIPDRPQRCRILRSESHEIIPFFPERWFPRNDDESSFPLYCAAVLALLTPWRQISDLKDSTETFVSAFNRFMQHAPAKIHQVLENIQYYYSCADKAKRHASENVLSKEWKTSHERNPNQASEETSTDPQDSYEEGESEVETDDLITVDDIDEAIQSTVSARERLYADVAINIANRYGVFSVDKANVVQEDAVARISKDDDLRQFERWSQFVEERNRPQTNATKDIVNEDHGDVNLGYSQQNGDNLNDTVSIRVPSTKFTPDSQNALARKLNDDQYLVYSIIKNHLYSHLQHHPRKQLLIFVGGHGGVGKTFLIEAIEDLYASYGMQSSLAKTATTGVAASNIGGSTIHSWAGLPVCTPRSDTWAIRPNPEMTARRHNNIFGKHLLIIDEISMLTTDMLADLSRIISIVLGKELSTEPLGGLNVMFCGDFHQLPPVGKFLRALFHSKQPTTRSEIGRNTFVQFETVVFLTQQMRIQDHIWENILTRVRIGECTKDDLAMVRSLILGHSSGTIPDFSSDPWKQAVLVTPRNSVRVRWNELALKQHCKTSGHIEYHFFSEDATTSGPLTMQQKLIVARMPIRDTGDLEPELKIALESPVMVTENIAPSVKLANGCRGTISDILMDPREPVHLTPSPFVDCDSVRLHYPPMCIIIRLLSASKSQVMFEGLPPNHVPIFPLIRHFFIGHKPRTRITRRQLPLTLAYAFTDYKSQGQTLPHVIVDIGKTTSFRLSPFNAYVSLSRGRNRSSIRLLRDFEDTLLTRHPCESLRQEDQRLDLVAKRTRDKFTKEK